MSAGNAPEASGGKIGAAVVAGAAGRYALALFELAKDAGALDAVAQDLNALEALAAGSDAVRALITSPLIQRGERGRALLALLDNLSQVSDAKPVNVLTRHFFGVLAENGRVGSFGDIITAYRALVANERGEVTAEVVSAQALSGAQVEALKAKLKSVVGRDVTLDARIDESLLGGLVVKVGSRMIDTSLKTKLQNLQVAMKEVG
ncbi:F0F1 ATP synthase subunit delta [Govanella unica]|uniref:F0F1 ATP synthase subunit delta n=1 Tax=Govanella unica TaxID=2975056 RepID=UPI0023A7952A